MNIGERIKKYRKEKGMTQQQLAEAANIARSYLGDLERGRYNPSIETLTSISKALNISLTAFFIDDSHKKELYSNIDADRASKTAFNVLRLDATGQLNVLNYIVSLLNVGEHSSDLDIRYRALSPEKQAQIQDSYISIYNTISESQLNSDDLVYERKLIANARRLNKTGKIKLMNDLEDMVCLVKYTVPEREKGKKLSI